MQGPTNKPMNSADDKITMKITIDLKRIIGYPTSVYSSIYSILHINQQIGTS